jgi:peptidoglycan hydrolase CwlO-like protein
MLAASKKKKVFDPNHMGLVKDKEIENSQNQLAAYEREIEALQAKIDEISQVDKMLEREQMLKDNKLY